MLICSEVLKFLLVLVVIAVQRRTEDPGDHYMGILQISKEYYCMKDLAFVLMAE